MPRLMNEVNLYNHEAIAAEFSAKETKISAIQGQIRALISESEMQELIDGGKTMYSAVNDIKIDVNGISGTMSSMQTSINANTGAISSVDSKVATYKASVDQLAADLSTTRSNLQNNYSTTETMTAAINAKAGEVSSEVSSLSITVSQTYETKSDSATKKAEAIAAANANTSSEISSLGATVSQTYETKSDSATKKTEAIAEANANTERALANYALISYVESSIRQSSDAITLQVKSIRSIVDEKNGIYYGNDAPTGDNIPAVNWNTKEIKACHRGDIYYDANGYSYQYGVTTGGGLIITFSELSRTEAARLDYVRIFYKVGESVFASERIGGTEISGATVIVPASVFWLHWHTDSSINSYYGFSIASIERFTDTREIEGELVTGLPEYDEIVVSGDNYPESEHNPYNNKEDKLWKYSFRISFNPSFESKWKRKKDADITAAEAAATAAQRTANSVESRLTVAEGKIEAKADRIELEGLVTISSLAAGTTTINGACIETGTLTADKVMGGTFKAGGSSSGTSGKNGVIEVYNSSNNRIGRWDNSGLYIGNISSNLTNPKVKISPDGILSASDAEISGTITTISGSDEIRLDQGNMSILNASGFVGKIGANRQTVNSSTYDGLVFDLNGDGDYMAWAARTATYGNYNVKFAYANRQMGTLYYADTLNAFCTLDMHNYAIKNASFNACIFPGTTYMSGSTRLIIPTALVGKQVDSYINVYLKGGLLYATPQ